MKVKTSLSSRQDEEVTVGRKEVTVGRREGRHTKTRSTDHSARPDIVVVLNVRMT